MPSNDAEQVLHVVADLVGNDVGPGKITARPQPLLHFLEETQVYIYLFIPWAVERAGGRLGVAAG